MAMTSTSELSTTQTLFAASTITDSWDNANADPLNQLLASAPVNLEQEIAPLLQSRSWGEWVQDKLLLQVQCSFSAVMVARWLSQAMFGAHVSAKVT